MKRLTCILLIDDDEITNFVHESLIEDLHVTEQVLIAQNGREALELINHRQQANQECIELIFLDINMPVMNGFEFLEAYQQLDTALQQSIVIVMLTSSLNPKDQQRVENTPAADYLNKPLTEENLKKVLEKHFP